MIKYSLVIPTYKAESSLEELYKRILETFFKLNLPFEIIFVEDCGNDKSWEIIERLALKDSKIKGIKMNKNFGQHNALLAGIRAAQGEFIITLDDDLQHPPEEIPKLLHELDDQTDVVYGYPKQERHSLLRNLGSIVTKLILKNAMGIKTAKHVSAFRLFRTNLRTAFEKYNSPSINIDVLLTWGTNSFKAIPTNHVERIHGKSNYTAKKLITHAMNMITGYSTIPLKLAGAVGIIFILFGASILTYVVITRLILGAVVPGFAFLASIICLFSGAQLFALGVIGEYLARIYQLNMNKPSYLIDKKI